MGRRNNIVITLLAAALAVASACSSAGSVNNAEKNSVLMLRSEMERCPEASFLDGMEGKLKWNYTTGLELKAMLDVYRAYGDESIFDYAEQWYDEIIDADGNIKTYKKANYNTDHICPARTLFYLYDRTGKDKYRKAIDTAYVQLQEHPRTSEGGFWHKQTYPWQMWLDGLYMAQPFYAEYNARYNPESVRDSVYRDIINHFNVVASHTYDPATRLYRHAWDESREMFWCDKTSGQSAHAWGRALGWYTMALVEVLEWIPEDSEGRDSLVKILSGIVDVLPEYADPQTGMWYQVLDSPGREGNYVEATCSAMFIYAMLKGARLGLLDQETKNYARDCYDAFVRTFVRIDSDGLMNIDHCCAVAGLGGKDNRSGDFDYYINEKVISNDCKGVGPFIWASLEMERGE